MFWLDELSEEQLMELEATLPHGPELQAIQRRLGGLWNMYLWGLKTDISSRLLRFG